MILNDQMNKRQQAAYDKTVEKIRDSFGSFNQIALRIYANCGMEVTGETIRQWFANRRVPTHVAFVLYEIMEGQIDPLALCPWLAEHVNLKQKVARSESA